MLEVLQALKKILKKCKTKFKLIESDRGKEFENSKMQKFLKSINIHHYFNYSLKKAVFVERQIQR